MGTCGARHYPSKKSCVLGPNESKTMAEAVKAVLYDASKLDNGELVPASQGKQHYTTLYTPSLYLEIGHGSVATFA